MKKYVIAIVVILLVGTTLFIARKPSNPMDILWEVFNSYVEAASAKDVGKIEDLSYQLSAACKTLPQGAPCEAALANVAAVGSKFKKEEMSILLSDDKQAILSSPYRTEETDIARGVLRKVIYFAKVNGEPKVLYFTQPDEITYTFLDKKATTTTAEIDQRLLERTKDSDQDGLPDEVETCTYLGDTKDCVKTDPSNRDTDGDGWWDGVEIYLRK